MEVEGERIVVTGDRTSAIGEFWARSPDERHTLGIFLKCPTGSRTYWAFAGEWGEKGFVADEDGRYEPEGERAEPITGMHRPTIDIVLPESRAALLERYCQKRE